MFRVVEGRFHNGQVELPGQPASADGSRVVVIFVEEGQFVKLSAVGISLAQAADLRLRLTSFAEDWERPEMDVYDAV